MPSAGPAQLSCGDRAPCRCSVNCPTGGIAALASDGWVLDSRQGRHARPSYRRAGERSTRPDVTMGVVMAALWDILAKAANLAQMSGLHFVMLIAVGMSLLRIPQSRRECAKLERCSRRLHALLQWPTGCGAVLLCSEMGGPVLKALVDAAGLVASYEKSTVWNRVRRGRGMAAQLRDMRDVVDSYCGLLLYVNAHLLLQPAAHRPPSDTTYGVHEVNENDTPQSRSVLLAVTNSPGVPETRGTQRHDNDGEGGTGSRTDDTGPAGRERSVTA